MEGRSLERRENKRDKDDEQKVRKVYTIHVHMYRVQSNLFLAFSPKLLSTSAAMNIN